MLLKEKIREDLKKAIKSKTEKESSVLRMILAAILNKEKENRHKLSKEKPELGPEELEKESQLSGQEVVEVISSEAKKSKEAIVEFEKGGREDLVEKEKGEIEILRKYLPEQLPEEEVRKLAKEVIEKLGVKELQDVGKVMKELMPQLKGKADGNLVSSVVKELLTLKT